MLENPVHQSIQNAVHYKKEQRGNAGKHQYHNCSIYNSFTRRPNDFEPFRTHRFDKFNNFFHVFPGFFRFIQSIFLAGAEGIEPSSAVLETDILPLN